VTGGFIVDEFLLLYRLPARHENDDTEVAAWNEWLSSLGDDLTDPGRPVIDGEVAGRASTGLRLAGYSTVRAEDLAAARDVAGGCPALAAGGAVEVGRLVDMPEGHGPE